MAWIVGDSFDYYAGVADLARSVWDSFTNQGAGVTLSSASRFGVGQAYRMTGGGTGVVFTKNMPTNESILFIVTAYYRVNALSGTSVETYFQLRDGATAQCTVVMQSNGDIVLKSGVHTGTVLATYAGAYVQDVWTHFQIRVVISATAGSMTVRKNGQTSDTYASATNLNTRGGTANNYANVIAIGEGVGAGTNHRFLDDLLIYSGSGAAPNDWVGDVRAVCLPPQADTAQKDFTPSPAATGTVATGTLSSGIIYNANTLRFTAFAPAKSGTITKVTLTHSAAQTGNIQCALYDATGVGGLPGALLATSAVVTNPVSGANDYTFSGGPALAQGRVYYLAVNHNIPPSPMMTSNGGGLALYYTQVRTYAAGFPNPAGAVTSDTTQLNGLFTLSGNVYAVSEALANGDTDYVFSATVNHADLYDMDDLQFTPQSIVGVVGKVYIKKSDAGARNGQILMKSGATQVAGPDTVLSSTYTYYSLVQMTDPATGTTWTTPGLAGVQVGQKVTA
jgi:hypothetical protein